MTQTETVALIAASVGVVLGAIGVVAGLIGYVQGGAALRRATVARQRATAAEEAATQAREQAERAARSAERMVQAARSMGAEVPPTGPIIVVRAVGEGTGPVPIVVPPPNPELVSRSLGEPAEPPREPEPAVPTEPATSAAPPPAAEAVAAESSVSAAEETEDGADDRTDAEPASAAPVRTPASEATMDWEEALRTGSIPLPTISRGSYAPPSARRPDRGQPVAAAGSRFLVRHVGRQRYEVVNSGADTAVAVTVEGAGEDAHLLRPATNEPADVAADGTVAFTILHIEGREPAVRVRWSQDGTAHEETHSLSVS